VDNGFTNQLCNFTNDSEMVDRLWPMLHTDLTQTNGSFIQFFPFREIWFSTANSLHSSVWQSPTNSVSAGDLISSAGRVVKRNHELTGGLGIMPVVPDLGLDAVDVLPGGEIAWTAKQDIFSESLGPLHHGDLLSDRGRVIRGFTAFMAAFGPKPPVTDQGLDAVHVFSNGETWFSIETNFFSERLGRMVRRGDVLSTNGQIIRTNEELVALFKPADPIKDYGLDALYVWPSGEIWFSVETGFNGQHFEPYLAGDLLSDQGYVVFRNLDLVREFAPIEDLADFGVDALFIVTDTAPPAPAPVFDPLRVNSITRSATLQWRGDGRVFQLERATNVLGPFMPASGLMPDRSFEDFNALQNWPRAFYRLRQW
jgi:hypothetical protein